MKDADVVDTLHYVMEIVMPTLGAILFILSAYNIYNYIIKQKQYKQGIIVTFYVVANLLIIFIITMSVKRTRTFCSAILLLIYTSIPNLSMMLGLCQATALTTLAIQLNQLSNQKSDILKPDFTERPNQTEGRKARLNR